MFFVVLIDPRGRHYFHGQRGLGDRMTPGLSPTVWPTREWAEWNARCHADRGAYVIPESPLVTADDGPADTE